MRKTKIWFGGLVVGIMVLAGASFSCTPSQPSPEATSPGGVTKPYGSLAIGAGFAGGSIDPMYAGGIQFTMLGRAIWDTLLTPSLAGLQPGIAERWDISPEGKTHTFYLRKGVKFHDGSDLTAADVKFSLERMMGPQNIIGGDPVTWRNLIDRVEVKDDYTVAIHLRTASYLPLPSVEAQMTAVMPKKLFEEKGEEYFQKTWVGSGPWKVVSFVPGLKLVLEAVDSHWREVPKFKSLTIGNVPEESTRVAMLRTGELDMAIVSSDAIRGLKAAGLSILSYDAGTRYWAPVLYDVNNPRQHPVGDVRVRKALQLAINAQELANAFFGGAGGPYYLLNIPIEIEKKMKPDPFDPEGAKRLLAEAGYSGGFSVRITDVGAGGLLSSINAALGGYFEKIGIRANIVAMEYAAHRALYRAKLDPSLFNSIYNYTTGGQTPFPMVMPIYHHSKQGAFHNINNPELDKLLDKIPQTRDPVERERLNTEAAVLAKNEYHVLSVVAPYVNAAYGPKVGGMATTGGDVNFSGLQYETITHAK